MISQNQYELIRKKHGKYASSAVWAHVMKSNRLSEGNPNRTAPPPSENEMKWHLVHIREDIGSIAGVLCLANGLLAELWSCCY